MPDDIRCGRCTGPMAGMVTRHMVTDARGFVQLCGKCGARLNELEAHFLANVPPEDLLDLCGMCGAMAEGVEPVAVALGHGTIPTTVQCCSPCRAKVYESFRELGVSLG